MEDFIKVNPLCKLNSLMVILSICNDLVDRIKVAQIENEELQKLLIAL